MADLLERVKAPWTHCFVHLDAKADVSLFAKAAGRGTFLEDRRSVQWCGFSMVDATLRLLRTAFEDSRGFERFFLLSGVDCPVKSMSDIADALSADRDLIQVDRVLDPNGSSQFDRCINRTFLGDVPMLNERGGNRVFSRIAKKVGERIPRHLPVETVYYGASWWCLTRQTVADMLRFLDSSPRWLNHFRFSRSPDEMFFQTLAMALHPEKVAWNLTRQDAHERPPNVQATHYVDWDRPNPHRPRTLDMSDLEQLQETEALFARKFSSEMSFGLRECISGSSIIPPVKSGAVSAGRPAIP